MRLCLLWCCVREWHVFERGCNLGSNSWEVAWCAGTHGLGVWDRVGDGQARGDWIARPAPEAVEGGHRAQQQPQHAPARFPNAYPGEPPSGADSLLLVQWELCWASLLHFMIVSGVLYLPCIHLIFSRASLVHYGEVPALKCSLYLGELMRRRHSPCKLAACVLSNW
jgi:hypothetical protein